MPSYKIVVDGERCVGDGLCRERAEGTFDIDKELRGAVRDANGNTREDILFAALGCANGCISLYNEETGERVWPGVLSREEFDQLARRKREEMSPEEWQFWRDLGGGD